MSESSESSSPRGSRQGRAALIFVLAGLVMCGALAIGSLRGDSITFDETLHLTAGMSFLRTGDFRLVCGTPPLSQMWSALPLLFMRTQWSPPAEAWRDGGVWTVANSWLFDLNDGPRLMEVGRYPVVALLLALCVTVYAIAKRVFGPRAALVSFGLAVLSPELLAHGRLVTTDMAVTLAFMLALLTAAMVAERITWGRLLALVLAFSGLTLVKFSWPVILTAMGVMGLIASLRRAPIEMTLRPSRGRGGAGATSRGREISTVGGRLVVLGLVAGLVGGCAWLAIWGCFGWRYSAFAAADARAKMTAMREPGQAEPANMAEAWETALRDAEGRPLAGLTPQFIRWAREHRLLPEAYLFGLASRTKPTLNRDAYLCGRFSATGWYSYFPITSGIKTPLATLGLLIAGVAALMRRRAWGATVCGPNWPQAAGGARRDSILFWGLVTFAVTYGALAVASGINIGQRHILPIYPAVYVLAGAAVFWCATWARLAVMGMAFGWLAWANLGGYPHYLSYFNELVGGPANGYRFLADSNLDWGQDLARLAEFQARHANEAIKLAYFGSAEPRAYGVRCEILPSFLPFKAEPAALTPGTYVVSVSQLLGLFERRVRDEFWTPEIIEVYTEGWREKKGLLGDHYAANRGARILAAEKIERYEFLRPFRLIARLRSRVPDERIGWSMFVHRLSAEDIEALERP